MNTSNKWKTLEMSRICLELSEMFQHKLELQSDSRL